MKTCPQPHLLSGFAFGQLSEKEAAEIAVHLQDCEACQSSFASLSSDDSLVDELRHTAAPSFDDETACQSAMAAIEEMDLEFEVQTPTPAGSSAPARIREYQLLEKLGQGGMGSVYRAEHSRLGKKVAIKILPSNRASDPVAIARFEREMKVVGSLSHPNIVAAFDGGIDDGCHYLVMELIDGEDLSWLLHQHGPLSISDSCELIRQAANGLQYLHEQQRLHRDIKPSNIMLHNDGMVKLLDLGLGRISDIDQEDDLTSTGQILGTISYMSPEQIDGIDQLDIRADIYSLGATLFKLLTGKVPIADAEANTPMRKLLALATKEAPSITTMRSDLPSELSALVDSMLANDRDQRPAEPRQVANQLSAFVEGANLKRLLERADGSAFEETLDTNAQALPTRANTASPAVDVPKSTKPAAKSQRWSPQMIAIAIGVLAVSLVAAGIIISVRTKDGGYIVFTIDDPSIKVTIAGDEFTIDDAGRKIHLKEGQHALIVTAGDLTFTSESFELTKASRVRLKVRLTDKDPAVEVDGKSLKLAPNRPSGKANGAAIAAGTPWEPTAEQAEFFDAVMKLPKEARVQAVRKKLSDVNRMRCVVKLREAGGSLKADFTGSDAVTTIWPLAAAKELEVVDLGEKGAVVDFRPLQKTALRELSARLVLDNASVDKMLLAIPTLKTVNGRPLNELMEERKQERREIDEFAKAAKALSVTDVIAWINPRLKKLNPGSPATVANRRATSHDVIGYYKQDGEWTIQPRLVGGLWDYSPLRVLEFTRVETSSGNGTGRGPVFDLSPLKGKELTSLTIVGSMITDLTPLQGMPLEHLNLTFSLVEDLTPIQKSPLVSLNMFGTPLKDLRPLAKMRLVELTIRSTPVSDLSPLKGLPLTRLDCDSTPAGDFSVLKSLPLNYLSAVKGEPSDSYRWFRWGGPLQGLKDLSMLQEMKLEGLGVDFDLDSPQHESIIRSLKLKSIRAHIMGGRQHYSGDLPGFWKYVEKMRKEKREQERKEQEKNKAAKKG